jgi:hypothetical protein
MGHDLLVERGFGWENNASIHPRILVHPSYKKRQVPRHKGDAIEQTNFQTQNYPFFKEKKEPLSVGPLQHRIKIKNQTCIKKNTFYFYDAQGTKRNTRKWYTQKIKQKTNI